MSASVSNSSSYPIADQNQLQGSTAPQTGSTEAVATTTGYEDGDTIAAFFN